MPKTARNILKDQRLKGAIPKAGLADGGNLHLVETATGRKAWRVLYYLHKKKATIWIGDYPKMKLSDARKRRDEIERMAEKGIDPKAVRSGKTTGTGMTLTEFLNANVDDLAPTAPSARREWKSNMRRHIGKLGDMQLGEITGKDVAEAIRPIWKEMWPTAKKTLNALARALYSAKHQGLIKEVGWTNPADYRGSFQYVMKKPVHDEKHRKAIPHEEVPAFIAQLRAEPGAVALGLEWIALTCVREMEGMRAEWPEIDREKLRWNIPAHKMKGLTGKKKPHSVPISKAMLSVLERAKAFGETGYIFPAPGCAEGHFESGRAVALLQKLRPEPGEDEPKETAHGFRTAMFSWANGTVHSDRTVNAQQARAKRTTDANGISVTADQAQRAYDTDTLMPQRIPMLEDWGDFCTSLCVAPANAPAEAAEEERLAA
jgi:integrase